MELRRFPQLYINYIIMSNDMVYYAYRRVNGRNDPYLSNLRWSVQNLRRAGIANLISNW